jgi:hypothetical protein
LGEIQIEVYESYFQRYSLKCFSTTPLLHYSITPKDLFRSTIGGKIKARSPGSEYLCDTHERHRKNICFNYLFDDSPLDLSTCSK